MESVTSDNRVRGSGDNGATIGQPIREPIREISQLEGRESIKGRLVSGPPFSRRVISHLS